MKKLIYTLGIIAAAAFTFSSCQKEQSIEKPSGKLVTVSFTAEKAGLDTKTAAVEGDTEVSFIWTDEDLTNIKLFTVGEDADGKEELTVVANPTITKVSDTKLTISAQVAPNETYTFKAMLSGKWTNDGKKARLNDSQSPSVTNFDPKADVLISDNMEVTVGDAEGEEETAATSDLEMVFRRPVVVNKMTLKNLKAGEAIDKVVITSGKEIAGYFYADGTPIGDKKTITLNYNKEVTVPEGGQFPVYFITTPGTGHSLTVEVTTDQFIYTKSFAEGKSIDFNLGQFTKFNFALPAGVANTALSLPIEDSMEWAVNGSDDNAQLNVADIPVTKDGKKIYSEASYIYLGIDGLKFGSSSYRGFLTTSELDLSSAFYISVSARAWVNSTNTPDVSQVEFLVDGESVYKSDNLSAGFNTYVFNAPAATANSKISIRIAGKRGYIKDLVINTGAILPPPVIKVATANPMTVANTTSSQTIEYSIDNPTDATLNAALKDPSVAWISNIDYDTDGEVTFDVAAQVEGAAARSAVIVLSYEGADDVEVTVNQAAGPGGTTTKTFTIKSSEVVSNSGYAKYEATVDTRGWMITFGGNNKSVGTNSGNRAKCTLSDCTKYAVSPVTTSSIASAFASTTSIDGVKKISYTFNGGSNQANTNVYLLYSANGTDFSQMTLTSGTQGAAISSGAEFEFAKCSGYFAVLFEATNTSGAWRIDDVNLTFTYEE
jgi:hypothetical protein